MRKGIVFLLQSFMDRSLASVLKADLGFSHGVYCLFSDISVKVVNQYRNLSICECVCYYFSNNWSNLPDAQNEGSHGQSVREFRKEC